MKNNPIYQEYMAQMKDIEMFEKDYEDEMSYNINCNDYTEQESLPTEPINERYMEDEESQYQFAFGYDQIQI